MDLKDLGKNIKNDKLIEAMKILREGETKETLRNFFKEVTEAVFIAPARFGSEPQKDENGKLSFKGDVKVNFALLTNEQGQKVLPCFTDEETLSKSQFDSSFRRIILPYKQLSKLVLESNGNISGIAINPFTENCFISDAFIKNYDESRNSNVKEKSFAKGDKIKLRTPKYQPVAMITEANKFFEKHPEVTRAFLQMLDDGKGDDKYLIVLETSADVRPIIEELLPIVKPYSFGIELVFMKSTSMVGWKVTTITEPFYTKEGYVPVQTSKPENAERDEADIEAEDEQD